MTTQEKSQIKSLMMSPGWGILERLANDLINKIGSETKSKENEWELIKSSLLKDGQIEGIQRLINEVYNSQK